MLSELASIEIYLCRKWIGGGYEHDVTVLGKRHTSLCYDFVREANVGAKHPGGYDPLIEDQRSPRQLIAS